MGMGKGLLDSLIAEGGVKSRDLSWVIYIRECGSTLYVGLTRKTPTLINNN